MVNTNNSVEDKEIISKRKRLSYLNGYISRIRKIRIIMMVVFAVLMILFVISDLVLFDFKSNTEIAIIKITGVLVPILIMGSTYCISQISEETRLILESEREIYEICEYIFIKDELNDTLNEKALYDKYTTASK